MIRGMLNGYWIVIRGQLRGHNDTPFGRPTHNRPFYRPCNCRPKGIFGGFSYYLLVIVFFNIVPLIMEFTFSKVAMDWLIEKIIDLHSRGEAGAVANPSLEEMCQILAKSVSHLTPSAQRKYFEHCLLTLPTDGSEDDAKGQRISWL
jgi:hypothetical protein